MYLSQICLSVSGQLVHRFSTEESIERSEVKFDTETYVMGPSSWF